VSVTSNCRPGEAGISIAAAAPAFACRALIIKSWLHAARTLTQLRARHQPRSVPSACNTFSRASGPDPVAYQLPEPSGFL